MLDAVTQAWEFLFYCIKQNVSLTLLKGFIVSATMCNLSSYPLFHFQHLHIGNDDSRLGITRGIG